MALATLTPLGIGFLFFHPALMGSIWPNARGNSLPLSSSGINHWSFLLAALLFSFFLSFFLLNFNNDGINQEGDFDNFLHGAWHGFFVCMTVVIPVHTLQAYFGYRSGRTLFVQALFWLLTLPLMGGILDAMNHWPNVILPG